MDDVTGVRTHDAVAWAVVAVMAGACVLACRGLGFTVALLPAMLTGAGLLCLTAAALYARLRTRPRLFAGAIAFLQMTLFTVLAVVLSYALAARAGPLWDDRLAAVDAWLGVDWTAIVRRADGWPALLWIGGVAYHSLVAQMIVCIVVLSACGQLDRLRIAVAAATLSGAVTIAISGVVPALGNLFDPAAYRHLWPSVAWQERGLVAGLRSGTARMLDLTRLSGIVSFPSYHATLPVILAWALRPVSGLRVAAPVWAAVTILATPLFGGHYAVDVLAGLVLALLAIALAPRLMRQARESAPKLKPGRFAMASAAPVWNRS